MENIWEEAKGGMEGAESQNEVQNCVSICERDSSNRS